MPKRVIENPVLAIRYVAIHAEFKPEGNPLGNLNPLRDLWIDVQTHLNRVRDCQLRQKARERRELGDAIDKLSPLVASVVQGEGDGASITDDMLRLVPDEALRKKVFDWYSDLNNQKPETQPPEEREAQEKDLAARDKALKCGSAILNSLTRSPSKPLIHGKPWFAKSSASR